MRGAGRTSVFKGAILTVSMRWTDRLIGFGSTLILARLLVPADFGVVAMASLVVGLADVLLSLGVNVALIRNHNATPAHYNTAWTLRLAQSAIAATVVFVAAPAAALYFNDPRIIPVLRFMALGMLLVGMENIGIITFQKEMRFGLDFRFVFLKRIVGFLTTILAAWLLRSYWALVIGTLAGRSFGVLLSYQMHPMRPRFSLEKLKEIFSVSQWMLVNSIASYVNRNLDKILIGRRANATIVGGYTLADEISAMPSTEVLAPLNRVLFPAFVAAKNDLAELKRLYLLAQGVQSLLGISAGVGLALVAHDAVLVLLGAKWLFVVPFVQVLALANVVEAITTSGRYVLLTMGKIRSTALVNWLQVVLFAIGALLVLPEGDALQLASIRVVTVLAEFLVSLWLLMQALSNVGVPDIVRTVLRPLLATGVMALAVISMGQAIQLAPLAGLIVKIVTGVVSLPAAILLMWWVAGKPSGAESYLLDKAFSIMARRNT
jgi:lipopolysaccharide exporter